MGAGIGGSYEGRGRDIYIYGGDISATGGTAGAGIGGGCWTSEQDMDGDTAAYNINIYGGKVTPSFAAMSDVPDFPVLKD